MAASRLRRYFEELPRRAYLVAVVTGLLIAVASLVGALGLVSARADARALQGNAANARLLDAVASATAQAQVEGAALSLQPFTAPSLAAITKLHQVLSDDWERYRDAAYGDAPTPPAASRISSEIAQQGRRLTQGGRERPTAAALRQGAALQQQSLARTAAGLAVLQTRRHAANAAEVSTQNMHSLLFLAGLVAASALAFLTVVAGTMSTARRGRRYERATRARESELDAAVKVNEFEARLQRAFDLAATETRVYGVVRRGLLEAVPDMSVELLQADSSRAHFEQLVTTGDMSHRHCAVPSPQDCPAAQRGGVLAFVSNQAIDACPFLQDQGEPCSAVCVPVAVAGTTVGVVHATGEHGKVLDHHQRTALELVARRSSDRIGMLRAFARSEVQANMDPLTGLRNRRSLEDEVARLAASDSRYAVAFGDLDHFKMLNDVHGHGAGDEALRLFARVLRGALRPNDLVGRYGGEEFVVVLPECSQVEAVVVLERVRDQLAAAIAEFGGPHFTVSFGLAEARQGATFANLIATADAALLDAKAGGRDRVQVAGSGVGGAAIGEATSAQRAEVQPKELEQPTLV